MPRDPKPVAARPRRAAPLPADAAADIDKVVDVFCSEFCEEERYWWWPRSVWADPNQIIADGDDGSLYRVPFSTDSGQNVTFAEPIEVLETFQDLPAAAKAEVLTSTREASPARVFNSRDASPARAKDNSEQGVGDADNNVGMDPELLRAALGLDADATDEQVTAAAEARKAELAEAEETPEAPETAEETATAETPAEEPVAASAELPEGMVAVPADVWESVQEGAQAGAALATESEETRRDDTIAAACGVGKIAPAAKTSMENLHERDPESFYNLLTASADKGGLAPGLVPVSARGGSKPGSGVPSAAGEQVSHDEMMRMFGAGYAPSADTKVAA